MSKRWSYRTLVYWLVPLVLWSFVNRVSGADDAASILETTGVQGGLVVHIGCGDGSLTAALRANDRYVVQGLSTDPTDVAAARDSLQKKGLYGPVSVGLLRGDRLPYATNLVNLVVADDLATAGVTIEEVSRVLAPGGVACIRQGNKVLRFEKPRPETIDEWTHYLHDAAGNAVAADTEISPPKHIRWMADPLWSRSHEFNPSINALVTGGGRMFYILDEGKRGLPDLRFPARWVLCGRDGFSGKLLWKRPMVGWDWTEWNTIGMWSAPLTLNRRIVTDDERVFVTFGYKAPVSVLDAATGETIRVLDNTTGTDEMILQQPDGVLLLCVRETLSVASKPKTPPKRRMNPHEWTIAAPGDTTLVAIDSETGQELWRKAPQQVTILTLAAQGQRVCYHGGGEVVCLDLKTGEELWSTPSPGMRGSRHMGGTLVMHDDVVLFTSREGVTALAADDGAKLWSCPSVSGPGITHPPDLFVADGLVWGGDSKGEHSRDRTAVQRQGRDLHTGEVVRTIEIGNLISPLHHFRCYRSKATEDYLLLTKRGIEFIDLDGADHMRNDWLRAMCHYGFMPANGLVYMPPHHCFCYPGVKMNGFLAMSGEKDRAAAVDASAVAERLEKGPAYGAAGEATEDSSAGGDWPTWRGDALRSGHSETEVAAQVAPAWRTALGGKLTPPVIADGKLFTAEVDAHRVICLDQASGEPLWSFTADARIDSAPTIHQGLLLFGCRDGYVYCLRASDGALCWRRLVAPDDRRVMAFEQLESPWPVPGSVLVLDGVAYVSCGRSSFLDGGVRLYGLDPTSGEVLCQTCVEGPWPDVQNEVGRPFDMEGVKSDVLVTDGQLIYLFQMTFDKDLNQVETPRASNLGDRLSGRRLIATGGFLDDSWFDRTYWMYSNRWPGFYYANSAPKAGQILVFDDKTTYGLHVFTTRARLSPQFTPGTGYELFADDNENEPVLAENSINREKGPGFSRAAPPIWSKEIPVRARAMVLAGDKLFLVGPPDVVPEDDPYAAFDGRLGAKLWAVSAESGAKLSEMSLETLPVFDGLIAAGGKLYLVTVDGAVTCFE